MIARALTFGIPSFLLLAACDVVLPQGAFRCTSDVDCPSGWACRADRLCYAQQDSTSPSETPDSGGNGATPSDATPHDDWDDGGANDAGDAATLADAAMPRDMSDAAARRDSGDHDDPDPPTDAAAGDAADADDPNMDAAPAADSGEPMLPPADVDQPCSPPGAKACRGHASFDKLVCQGGKWMIIGVCDGSYRCNTKPGPSLGSCQPIAALCLDKNPGDAICDGLVRKKCDADLLGYDDNACQPNSHCASDATNGVRCVCDSGYADDGSGNCLNVDDCQNTCGPGTCVDLLNAYTCSCPPGFSNAGTTCANINDCPATNVCTPGSCVDDVLDYHCTCPADFQPAGKTCMRIDNCPPGACSPEIGGYCYDDVGTYQCICPDCWAPIDGVSCTYDPSFCFNPGSG